MDSPTCMSWSKKVDWRLRKDLEWLGRSCKKVLVAGNALSTMECLLCVVQQLCKRLWYREEGFRTKLNQISTKSNKFSNAYGSTEAHSFLWPPTVFLSGIIPIKVNSSPSTTHPSSMLSLLHTDSLLLTPAASFTNIKVIKLLKQDSKNKSPHKKSKWKKLFLTKRERNLWRSWRKREK